MKNKIRKKEKTLVTKQTQDTALKGKNKVVGNFEIIALKLVDASSVLIPEEWPQNAE